MKLILYVMRLMLMLLVVSGCHDESPVVRDDETSAEVIRANKAASLLSFFCKMKQGEDGKIVYTPSWGTVLYGNNPTVRYVVADDLDDARRWFFYFVQAAEPNMTQDIIEYKIEGHGSIRFSPSTTTDKIATIHVDFATLPEIREFVFITKDSWPSNDLSLFDYGAVYKNKRSGHRYVCIAESTHGWGCMITFDKMERPMITASISKGPNVGPHYYNIIFGLPRTWHIEMLRKFMYNYNRKDKTFIKNDLAVEIFEENPALCPNIYSDVEFLTGFSTPMTYVPNEAYIISPDHRKIERKNEVFFPVLDYKFQDLRGYVLSDTFTFTSSSVAEEFVKLQ